MTRNERETRQQLIDPALESAGWEIERELRIGPGRVNFSGTSADSMYDPTQAIVADYLLRYCGVPLAILEAKAETEDAEDGVQQASRYADRLMIRHAIATNGHNWILTDNQTGEYETLSAPPSPQDMLGRLGVSIDWEQWKGAFSANFHVDQVTRKKVRPYQEVAIARTLWEFALGQARALLLMATGTGKTFTVFQLVWKLMNGGVLKRQHVLFLTDRNSLKDQAYRAFSAFDGNERVTIDKATVADGKHQVGKLFFANYQNLDEELDGKKVYEHYDPDFFDLVVVDECHRSGFGDWFGVLEHFGGALQLGLTATPRDLEETKRPLTPEEQRRDTYHYFGEPIFTYSLKRAIDDGYLVPYLLEERVSNIDEDGYTAEDGKRYETKNFERDNHCNLSGRALAAGIVKHRGLAPCRSVDHDHSAQKHIATCFARSRRSPSHFGIRHQIESMTPEAFTQNQIEKYRQMTGEQRLLIGLNLHELSCEIARDGIRGRYPDADEAFVEEKLRERLRLVYEAQDRGESNQ